MANKEPSDTLWVADLPTGIDADSLKSIFTTYGDVIRTKILPFQQNPRDELNAAAAIVQMSSIDAATWLIENMNGSVLQGLAVPIHIEYAKKKKMHQSSEVPATGLPPGRVGVAQHGSIAALMADHSLSSDTLWVADLPTGIDEESLKSIFLAYGTVVRTKMLPDKPNPRDELNAAAAIVQMSNPEEAAWLVENMNGSVLQGLSVPVHIEFSKSSNWTCSQCGTENFKKRLTCHSCNAPIGGVPPGQPFVPGNPASDTVWVADLPTGIDEDSLKSIFLAYGGVIRTKMLPEKLDPKDPLNAAAAIVQMSNVDEATWLVENMNGSVLQGLSVPVHIEFSKSQNWICQLCGNENFKKRTTCHSCNAPIGASPGNGAAANSGSLTQASAWQGMLQPGLQPGVSPQSPLYQNAPGGYGKANSGKGKGAAYHPYDGQGKGKGKGIVGGGIKTLLADLSKQVFPQVDKTSIVPLTMSGLPPDTTISDVYQIFAPFGCPIKVGGVYVKQNIDGSCTGVAFVDVTDAGAAQMAVRALNGMPLQDGGTLAVQGQRLKGQSKSKKW